MHFIPCAKQRLITNVIVIKCNSKDKKNVKTCPTCVKKNFKAVIINDAYQTKSTVLYIFRQRAYIKSVIGFASFGKSLESFKYKFCKYFVFNENIFRAQNLYNFYQNMLYPRMQLVSI